MKVKGSRQKFNTPIIIGGFPMSTDESESVDKQIDSYLENKRKRILEEAKMAELQHVTEDEKPGAARSRKEREGVEAGRINPVKGEEEGESTEEKVKSAAEVAAAAASEGVSAEQAVNLGTGKSKVLIVKPEPKGVSENEGGWSVVNGKPVRDPEGEYTFIRALKVAQLEVPPAPTNGSKKTLAEELTEAKQKLEALGIPVGGTPAKPRSLREEVIEAKEGLESMGLCGGTNEQAPLKDQVAEAKGLLESLGLSIGIPGESLETLKEKHHHEERMNELTADKEYKKNITEIAGSIPERIGHGLGGRLAEEESAGGGDSGGSELEYFTCEEEGCGYKFPVPPDAGNKITCPKCGTIYSREPSG